MNAFPILGNGPILLQPMHVSHSKRYSEILSEEDTFQFLTERGPVNEAEATLKIVTNAKSFDLGKSVYWSILGGDNQFLGFIAIHNLLGERVYISYGIHPSQRRRGFGTEALQTVLAWDFLKNKEIEMAVHKENESSFQMLTKMGLKYHGVRTVTNGDRHIFTL